MLAARDFYKIADDDLLVVCDDFNLPLGQVAISRRVARRADKRDWKTSFAGWGPTQIPRLRIGIGSPPDGRDAADFVLGRFTQGRNCADDR